MSPSSSRAGQRASGLDPCALAAAGSESAGQTTVRPEARGAVLRRRSVLASSLAGVGGVVAAGPAAARPDSGGGVRGRRVLEARPVAALAQMPGACLVTHRDSGAWGEHGKIREALAEAGITWIRTRYRGGQAQQKWLGELAEGGVRVCGIMGAPFGGRGVAGRRCRAAAGTRVASRGRRCPPTKRTHPVVVWGNGRPMGTRSPGPGRSGPGLPGVPAPSPPNVRHRHPPGPARATRCSLPGAWLPLYAPIPQRRARGDLTDSLRNRRGRGEWSREVG